MSDETSISIIVSHFNNAAIAVNDFFFDDSNKYTNFKRVQKTLHLLSISADDMIKTKIDVSKINGVHDRVLSYLRRDVPDDRPDSLAEYRTEADAIIREYSDLISQAFK